MSTRQDDPGADGRARRAPGHDAGGDTAPDRGAGAAAKVRAWFAGRLPAGWFTAPPDIQVDREEITIVGTLADPAADGDSEAERAAAAAGRIRRFREETRSRADRDRPGGRAPVPAQGVVGSHLRHRE